MNTIPSAASAGRWLLRPIQTALATSPALAGTTLLTASPARVAQKAERNESGGVFIRVSLTPMTA